MKEKGDSKSMTREGHRLFNSGLRRDVMGGDLIRNKRASGRPKDAADAAALEKIAEGQGG